LTDTQDPTLQRPPRSGPPADLPEGLEVGEYRVQRKIGEGGMGAVYAAIHPVIGKQVAIKVLAPHLAARPDLVDRFIAEARAVNRIGHPNIVDIFSFGWLPGDRHYFVMEYLNGQGLHEWMKKRPLDIAETRRLLGQVCGALEAAHRAGIIHRDLKPDNIWVAQPRHGDSFAKLLDFGIAKLTDDTESPKTQTGMIMGTPAYMSPEQCQGARVDQRADIYSLGVILYQMFAGRLPFEGTFAELFAQHLTATPPPPTRFVPLPPALEWLILRCLEKSPEQRPGSAAALAGELDDALAALAEGRPAPGPSQLEVPATTELPPPTQPPPSSPSGTAGTPSVAEEPATSTGARRVRIGLLIAVGAGLALGAAAIINRAPAPAPEAPPASATTPSAATTPSSSRVRVIVQNAEAARVLIDGRVVASGVRQADVPDVEPDRPHLLRVEAPGKEPHERRFTVAPGAVVELQVALGAAGAPPPSAAAAAPQQAKPVPPTSAAAARPTAERPHHPERPAHAPAGAPPATGPGRHRDGLVGDDIFDSPNKR
jgi:serine/threonine-protein kinase